MFFALSGNEVKGIFFAQLIESREKILRGELVDFCGSAKTMPEAVGSTQPRRRTNCVRRDAAGSWERRQEGWEGEIHVFRPGAVGLWAHLRRSLNLFSY